MFHYRCVVREPRSPWEPTPGRARLLTTAENAHQKRIGVLVRSNVGCLGSQDNHTSTSTNTSTVPVPTHHHGHYLANLDGGLINRAGQARLGYNTIQWSGREDCHPPN